VTKIVSWRGRYFSPFESPGQWALARTKGTDQDRKDGWYETTHCVFAHAQGHRPERHHPGPIWSLAGQQTHRCLQIDSFSSTRPGEVREGPQGANVEGIIL